MRQNGFLKAKRGLSKGVRYDQMGDFMESDWKPKRPHDAAFSAAMEVSGKRLLRRFRKSKNPQIQELGNGQINVMGFYIDVLRQKDPACPGTLSLTLDAEIDLKRKRINGTLLYEPSAKIAIAQAGLRKFFRKMDPLDRDAIGNLCAAEFLDDLEITMDEDAVIAEVRVDGDGNGEVIKVAGDILEDRRRHADAYRKKMRTLYQQILEGNLPNGNGHPPA